MQPRLSEALRGARSEGWRTVRGVAKDFQGESDASFPGIRALTQRIRTLSGNIPPERGAPVFTSGDEVDRSADFWRAYYEAVPGQPLMGLMHVGLLLAAGDAARAHEVAVLWINFGRMSLAHREEFVGLDLYARNVLQNARRDRAADGMPKKAAAAERVSAARAALDVWPQNPEALARLAEAVWIEDGKPARIPPSSRLATVVAQLRRADPMSPVFARVAAFRTPDLDRVRRLWLRVSDDGNAGDPDLLRQFCAGAQAAGLDDLAQCARSLLGGWEPAREFPDETFVRTSLDRLIGKAAAESICSDASRKGRRRLKSGAEDQSPLADYPGPIVQPQLEQQMLVRLAGYSYVIDHGRLRDRALAAQYVGRGQAWIGLGRIRRGLADLRHSLRLDPGNEHARWNVAAGLGKSGDYAAADKLFAEAAKRTPANVGLAVGLANDLFMQQRWKEAAAAFERAAAMDPAYAFPHLMAGLARLRGGLPPEGRSGVRKKARDPWTGALVAFVDGEVDAATLRRQMRPRRDLQRAVDECKLEFVEGELALGRGDPTGAQHHFKACVGTGVTNYIEYHMARLELQRLDGGLSSTSGK